MEIYAGVLSAETIQTHYLRRWQAATLSATRAETEWQTTIPNISGSFQLRLRTTDSLGNVSFGGGDNANWNGYITPDTVPTATSLTATQTSHFTQAQRAVFTIMFIWLVTLTGVAIAMWQKRTERS